MADAALEARGISRSFGSVQALRDVTFDVNPGEVVGLIGDNGAGKSTLLNILCGALSPTAGELLVDGKPVAFRSPRESRDRGIEVVYQDLALATQLTVAENIFLGRERRATGWRHGLRVLDWRGMRAEAQQTLASLGIEITDVSVKCGQLSGGQRQAVAVARAVRWGSKVLLLDEPTAALAVGEQRKIEALIEEVRRQHDVAVVLVSHNLPQVHEVADRIFVLRRGAVFAVVRRGEATVEDLVMLITGFER